MRSADIIKLIDSVPFDESVTLTKHPQADKLFKLLSGYEFSIEEEKFVKEEYLSGLHNIRNQCMSDLEKWYKRKTTKDYIEIIGTRRDPLRIYFDVFAARMAIKYWENNRQVYKFNSELTRKLEDTDITKYNSNYFSNLPYNDFMILFDGEDYSNVACIVHLNDNSHFTKDVGKTLSFHLLFTNERYEYNNILPTMYECMTYSSELKTYEEMSGCTSGLNKDTMEMYKTILKAVMFISAGNSGVTTETEKHKRKVFNTKKHKTETKEVTISNNIPYVRTRYYGSNTSKESSESHSNGKSPAPHIRRGHYHCHWVGKKGNQKLVPMWHEPVYVNMNNKEVEPRKLLITNNIPTREFKNSFEEHCKQINKQ